MTLPRAVAESTVTFRDVLSDDGTVIRAWTNDPEGIIDGPTVLLCNGLGTSPWNWPALLHTSCGVRVVSWQHRGTTGADRPDDPARTTSRHFAEDALSVMDAFVLARPVVLGWSIGVNTAFELAADHPERVSGVFGVAGVPGDTFRSMLGPLRLPAPAAGLVTRTASRVLRRTGSLITPLASRLDLGPRAIAAFSKAGLIGKVPDPELAAVALAEFLTTPVEWYFHLALRTSQRRAVSLRRIKVPVMLVAGNRDLIAGARHMARVADGVKNATYVELDGTHFIQMEQPARVHQLLLSFLDRVAERQRT
ncbi:pimeloyl-ACP methyl ester carboxylesterase [Nocardioides albertanoniae]|uniref:Pimeloyl-ACP methyl ester carboxylesterase n=1 Tax=Nocardioides albertanoniae TaxID=1175486 RepID=A0A543AAG1_9ACTN|nr:alpha/beta hydrolase [Nocardioides albertanoniae]TQL69529.1 pimeloyl-ACP methyl ester carboxylesterase [Nocardioides albertanoniae]